MKVRGILRRVSAMLMALLIVIGTTPVSVYRAEGTASLTINVDMDKVDVTVTHEVDEEKTPETEPVEGDKSTTYADLTVGEEYTVTVKVKDTYINTHAVYSVKDGINPVENAISDGVYTEVITLSADTNRSIELETFYDYTVNMNVAKGSVIVSDGTDEITATSTGDNVATYKLSDQKNYTFSYQTLNGERFDTFNGNSLDGATTYQETVNGDDLALNASAGTNVATLNFYSDVDYTITVNLPLANVSIAGEDGVEDGSGNTEFTVKKGSTPTLTIDPKDEVFKTITIGGVDKTPDDKEAVFTTTLDEVKGNKDVVVDFLDKYNVTFVVNGAEHGTVVVNSVTMDPAVQPIMQIAETKPVALSVKTITDGYYVSNIAVDGVALNIGQAPMVDGARTHTFTMPTKDVTITIDITALTETSIEYTGADLTWAGIDFENDVTNHNVILSHTESVVLSKAGYNLTLSQNSSATANVTINKTGETVTTITDVWAYATDTSVSLADSMIHYKLVNPLTIVIDETAPIVTNVTAGNTLWYGPNSNKTTISVDAIDVETDVTHVVYFTSQQANVAAIKAGTPLTKNGNTYTFDATYTDGVADSTTYYIYAVNESDAYTEVNQIVKVDNAGPDISKMKADTTTSFLQKLFTMSETVTVEVTAKDNQSNIKSFRLGVSENGGTESSVNPTNVVENNDGSYTATFTLRLNQYKEYTIQAYATDNMNNECLAYTVCEDTQGNAVDAILYYDIVAPNVSLLTTNATHVSNVAANTYHIHTANTGDALSSVDFEAHFKADDHDVYAADAAEIQYVSGIEKYTVDINGSNVLTQSISTSEKVTALDDIEINTADLLSTAQKTGSYEITLTVYDIAGNQTEKTIYVYVDNTKPEVDSVKYNNQTVTASSDDYVFYGNGNMVISVNPTESGATDSGIQYVEYWFNDNSDAAQIIPTQGNGVGVYNINVNSDFKGTLHVKAVDYSGFASDEKSFNIIRESNGLNNTTSSIEMAFDETPLKDANNNPLYTDSAEVDITVKDSYSGIKALSWSVIANYDTEQNTSGSANVAYNGTDSFVVNNTANSVPVTWTVTESEKNIATEITATLPINNNSNDIKVTVTITDNAGNTRTLTKIANIDKTKPSIEITFDSTNSSGYYTARTATITVYDRNFDPSKVTVAMTNTDKTIPAVSAWTTKYNTTNPDKSTSTATIAFSADGDYTLKVDAKDKCNLAAETASVKEFTIDKTAPKVTVSYDNNTVLNEKYYASARTATITVTEHNFDADNVTINGTATFNGGGISFPAVGGWSSNGDVHTTTLAFSQDAAFEYDITVKDDAGNSVQHQETEFSVDTTIPEITITGVEDMSSNNGEVAPVITITDENYDQAGVNIELTGANQGNVEPVGSFSDSGTGQVFTFANFAEEQSSDDLYTLVVTETDKAGNMFEDSITFSVNRFGSVYTFSDELAEINGKYVTEAVDVVITETNVDGLDYDSIKVVLTTNGTPRTLVRGEDYTLSQTGGGGSWSQYEYRIAKEMFKEDGAYSVAIYSVDNAGNVNENINETKEAEVFFGIDTVNPIITAIDLESGKTYEATSHNAVLSITDNLVLGDVSINVNGEPVEYEVNGTDYSFVLNESSNAYTIAVNVTDKAGNMATMTFENVLVTTNAFVRVLNSPVALIVGGGTVGVAGIGVGAFFFMRNKNIIKVKRK